MTPLPRLHFMCARHWALVPITLQVEITNAYRPRACMHTPAYYEACADAIEFVARQEKRPTTNRYRSITKRFRARAAQKQMP